MMYKEFGISRIFYALLCTKFRLHYLVHVNDSTGASSFGGIYT